MSLGSKIRDLRLAKGLTQSDLGSGLVTPSMISQIESDKANPSYKVLEEIARKLETPLEYFLTDIQVQLEQASAHRIAKTLIASGDKYDKAAKLLESLLANPSPTLNVLSATFDLGECYLNMGRYEEARGLFEKVVDMGQQKGDLSAVVHSLNKLGIVEEARGKNHEAVYQWRRACQLFDQLSPSEPLIESKVLMNLGTFYYRISDYQEAVRYYSLAYERLSNSNDHETIAYIYYGLGEGYHRQGEFEKAIEYTTYAQAIFESLKQVRSSIHAKRVFGMIQGEEGEFATALKVLEECIDDYQRNNYLIDAIAVYGDIASLYLREHRYDECLKNCEFALTGLPLESVDMGRILVTKGMALQHQGRIDEAVQSLEQAAEVFESHQKLADLSETYSILGTLYAQHNDLLKSNESLQNMRQAMSETMRKRGF